MRVLKKHFFNQEMSRVGEIMVYTSKNYGLRVKQLEVGLA